MQPGPALIVAPEVPTFSSKEDVLDRAAYDALWAEMSQVGTGCLDTAIWAPGTKTLPMLRLLSSKAQGCNDF